MADWFVYMIKDEFNTLYTGVTIDVERRFREHVEGGKKAAKYLRSKKDLELVYSCRIGDKKEAYRIEAKIKMLNKDKKDKIVKDQQRLKGLKKQLGMESP